jgi:hypothetical protein
LLKQQALITIYRLLIKENKLPFTVSVCSKQMVAVFVHRLQQKNKSNCFSFVPLFVCRILETWRHGHGILTFCEKNKMEKGSLGDFP